MVEQVVLLMVDGPFLSKMLNIAFSRWHVLNRVTCHNGKQVKGNHDAKNVWFDLSDSLIWLSSTPPCTFQALDLDLHLVVSSSLSGGGELINLFDEYPWKTRRAHLSCTYVCRSVLLNLCDKIPDYQGDIFSETLDCFREGQPVCTAYFLIAPGI